MTESKLKTVTCPKCKTENDMVGIMQVEKNYYYYNLNTDQMEDFHGDGTVEKQEYFCLSCKGKINTKNICI